VIGVAIAFIVAGVIFLFLVQWIGIVAGIVGLVLAILWVAGFGRGAPERDVYADRGLV
jgi:predicted anti-sigma-YlaC factor YlaD